MTCLVGYSLKARVLLPFCISLLSWPPLAGAPDRLPIPDKKAQADVDKEIEKTYGNPPEAPDKKVAVAKEMISDALKANGESAFQYRLLIKARDWSASAGNVSTAAKAIEVLNSLFAIRGEDVKSCWDDAWKANTSKNPEVAEGFGEACLEKADSVLTLESQDEIEAWRFDAAKATFEKAEDFGEAASNDLLQAWAKVKQVEVQEAQKAFDGFLEAKELLKKNPDDSKSNLATGRFLCLFRNRWGEGLPFLAKCTGKDKESVDYKSLAILESGQWQKLQDLQKIADGWFKLASASKTPRSHRRSLFLHAMSWYKRMIENAKGRDRIYCQTKLDEIERETVPGKCLSPLFAELLGQIEITCSSTDQGGQLTMAINDKGGGKPVKIVDSSGVNVRVMNVMKTWKRGGKWQHDFAKDPQSGNFKMNFQIQHDTGAVSRLEKRMKSIKNTEIVVIIVCDSIISQDPVDEAIRSIGGKTKLPRTFLPCAYICIGIRGLPPGCALEKYVEHQRLVYPTFRLAQ